MAEQDLNTQMRMGDTQDSGVLKTMLTFTVMMVTLPILTYFISKSVLEDTMGLVNGYLYAAGFAVLVVHGVLALFIYSAWGEGSTKIQKTE